MAAHADQTSEMHMPRHIPVVRVDSRPRPSSREDADHSRQVRLVRASLWRRPEAVDAKRRSA
jgi:hypothetical protein